MTLSTHAELPAETITRLERALQHVREQCQTAHRMAMYFRAKYRATDAERQRLETQLKPKQQHAAQRRQDESQGNIDARFGPFLDEPADEDAVANSEDG